MPGENERGLRCVLLLFLFTRIGMLPERIFAQQFIVNKFIFSSALLFFFGFPFI